MSDPILQIVGPTDQWILERLARKLAAKLPYAEFVPWRPQPRPATRLVYYVNYALYQHPSGLIDVAFFTHHDDTQQFLERARRVDRCVCMAKSYVEWLQARGVRTAVHVPMGFDSYRYRPRLVLGVIGRLDHPRKGRHLVEALRRLPFVELVTTDGQVAEEQLPEFYQRLDYVLIPATVEGGPLSLLEGLALGKPVIAPESVGMVPEFGETELIRRYPAGDCAALVQVVTGCYREKVRGGDLVRQRTWDDWAEGHDRVFRQVLQERGLEMAEAAPGFRFGLIREIEVPLGSAADQVEAWVDRAAAHLYYGREDQARVELASGAAAFPCLEKLLKMIAAREPREPRESALETPAVVAHLKAMRGGR